MQTTSFSASETVAMPAADRLIVALDTPTLDHATELVSSLGDSVSFYKVGWRLFLQGGLPFVASIRSRGKRVFLDLKMDDIGETIETAVSVLKGNADLLTLMGTPATVRAAVRGRGDSAEPKLLSVTYLSSLDETDLRQSLPTSAKLPTEAILDDFVCERARNAVDAGADGLIASGDTLSLLRREVGWKPLIVTPGIRPAGAAANDQKRTKTPADAIADGADLLVVGRPIWAASDPIAAAQGIIEDIDEGLARRV